VSKLRIAIWVIGTFLRLAVALQAVALVTEELANLYIADRMMLTRELGRQGARAFTNPSQGRFGITPRFGLNQPLQTKQQLWIGRCDSLPPTARPPDTPFGKAYARTEFS
jgi:hypothetical protein